GRSCVRRKRGHSEATMRTPRLFTSFGGSFVLAALMGCNVIVGTDEISYVDDPTEESPDEGETETETETTKDLDGGVADGDADADTNIDASLDGGADGGTPFDAGGFSG